MVVVLGLLILVAACAVAVAGVAANSGTAHPVAEPFAIFGQHLTGLSTGQLFLYGLIVGAVAMLGLSMLLGAFTRRLASHGARRQLKGSQREITDVRADRDRLAQQLQDEQSERLVVAPNSVHGSATGVTPSPTPDAQ